MAGKRKRRAPGKKRAAIMAKAAKRKLRTRAGMRAKATRIKAPRKPARRKSAIARKRPSPSSLRVGRETFEAAPVEQEMLPVRHDALEKLDLPKPPAAAPARKKSIVPPGATAIAGATVLTAAIGGAIFLWMELDLIIAAGLLFPLFVGAAILIYSRLEDGERRQK